MQHSSNKTQEMQDFLKQTGRIDYCYTFSKDCGVFSGVEKVFACRADFAILDALLGEPDAG